MGVIPWSVRDGDTFTGISWCVHEETETAPGYPLVQKGGKDDVQESSVLYLPDGVL